MLLLFEILVVEPSNQFAYMVEDQQEKAYVSVISDVPGEVCNFHYQIVSFTVALIYSDHF